MDMSTSFIDQIDFSYWPLISLIFGVTVIVVMHIFRATLQSKLKSGYDLILYLFGVVAVLGLVGFGLKFAPGYYRSLGGVKFLSAMTGTPEVPVFDAQAFFGLVGILTGIPIALAGSIYAVLLARRAEATETQKFEADLEARLGELTLEITTNFSRMTEALLDINAAAAQLFEQTSWLCSRVISDPSTLTLSQCVSKITESGNLVTLKNKINALRDCMANIQRHDPSMDALREMLRNERKKLAAFHFSDNELSSSDNPKSKFYKNKQDLSELSWTWLSYAWDKDDHRQHDVGKLNVVDPLEMLRLQVGRLCCEDVLMAVFEGALLEALSRALIGQDVSGGAFNPDVLFADSWVTQSTRQKEEIYWLRPLGRMLLVRPITEERPGYLGMLDLIVNFGAVILEDLYRLIPDKASIEVAVRSQSVCKRLKDLKPEIIKEHFDSISYASKELVPNYFKEGVNDSFRLNPETGVDGQRLLLLRLPKYISEIDRLIRNGIEQPDNFREQWSVYYREYLIAGLIEDTSNVSSSQTLGDTKALSMNANIVHGLKQELLSKASGPNLVSRYLLHLADISMAATDTAKAKDYYCLAFEGGRPATVQQLSLWLEGIVGKLPFKISIQGNLLAPDEVAAGDGLLPIIGFQFLDGMLYRSDKKALVDYTAEFPVGHVFPDFVELWPKFQKFLEALPPVKSDNKSGDGSKSNNTRSLDSTYKKWHEYVTLNRSMRLEAKLDTD